MSHDPAAEGLAAKALLKAAISVKDFGAVGDGVTDDTVALQAALDSGPGPIGLPAATYLVGPLVVNGKRVTLYTLPGASGTTDHQAVIKLKDNAADHLITVSGANSCILLDAVSLDGNRANQTQALHCIYVKTTGVYTPSSFVLKNGSRVRFAKGNGVEMENLRGSAVVKQNSAISGCDGYGFHGDGVLDCLFHGSEIGNTGLSAIKFTATGSASSSNNIVDCDMYNAGQLGTSDAHGVWCAIGVGSLFISGGQINTNGGHGVLIEANDPSFGRFVIAGTYFLNNSVLGTNLYSSIKSVTPSLVVTGDTHYQPSANKVKYILEASGWGLGKTATWVGSYYAATDYATNDTNAQVNQVGPTKLRLNEARVVVNQSVDTNSVLEFYAGANGNNSYQVLGNGTTRWGPGTAGTDVTLFRSAADVLSMGSGDSFKTDGTWNGGTFRLGAYYLWVDATGRLRIKSGAPTSDTDGTVVGAQS